jgi:hypothetical protein
MNTVEVTWSRASGAAAKEFDALSYSLRSAKIKGPGYRSLRLVHRAIYQRTFSIEMGEYLPGMV